MEKEQVFFCSGWLFVLDRISLCRPGSTGIRSVHQVDRELVYLPLILSAVIKDLQYYCQAQKLFLTVEPSFPHHGFGFFFNLTYLCLYTYAGDPCMLWNPWEGAQRISYRNQFPLHHVTPGNALKPVRSATNVILPIAPLP